MRTRTHEEIIAAILANLEMARDVAQARISEQTTHCNQLILAREAYAFQQAINLVKAEAGLP